MKPFPDLQGRNMGPLYVSFTDGQTCKGSDKLDLPRFKTRATEQVAWPV